MSYFLCHTIEEGQTQENELGLEWNVGYGSQ